MTILNDDLTRIFNGLTDEEKAKFKDSTILITGCGGFLGYYFTKQKPVVLTGVSLSQETATSKYYTGEDFSFDGLFINVSYSDGSIKKVKLEPKYLNVIEGGSVEVLNDNIQFLGGSVLMTFNYEGHNLSYSVEVKNKELQGIDVRYSDNIFNLEQGDYIIGHQNGVDDLIVLFNYGEYGFSKSGSYNFVSIKVNGMNCLYEAGKGWKLPVSTIGTGVKITIEYNNDALDHHFEVEIEK